MIWGFFQTRRAWVLFDGKKLSIAFSKLPPKAATNGQRNKFAPDVEQGSLSDCWGKA